MADASPLNYLTLIAAVHVLQRLYGRVLVPRTVAVELQNTHAPVAVRAWIEHPPASCDIQEEPPTDPALAFLDPGERAAIALALAVSADRIRIDDIGGRTEAEHRYLFVTGTLAVLADARFERSPRF